MTERSATRLSGLLPDKVLALQKDRLRRIIRLVMLAFALLAAMNLTRSAYANAAFELVIIGVLLVTLRWNQSGHLERAAAMMIAVIMLGLSVLMANDQGLFDEAPLAFPALLVFAGLFGSRRLLVLLMVAMLVVLASLFVLDRLDVLHSVANPLSWRRLVIMGMIIAFSGFFVMLLASDLRQTLLRLEAEKLALQTSRERIALMAQHDSLTGLPNRVLARERLESQLRRLPDGADRVAVMFLDLDNFKTINDSLGHAVGDELLCKVADVLRLGVRGSDTVARMSGDEFLIVLGDLVDEEAVAGVASKIMQLLTPAIRLGKAEVLVTASMGIAMAPRDGIDAEDLLKHADLAMYQAKDAGRNLFRFFDAGMNQAIAEHLRIASGLRAALAGGQLAVHYQPKFDLATGEVVGAEALLRWPDAAMGAVPIATVIAVAERSGLIHDLGAFVLRQSCADASAWRQAGLSQLMVAVNVSPLQFRRGDLEHEITQALQAAGLPAAALELELTESTLADTPNLAGVLQRLGAAGVKVTIDDFGTGYSNLGYLRQLAVHRLKIDQSFVRRLCDGPHDEGLVRAIIELARCLDLQTIAEGIEDVATLERLRDIGCEFGQGFLWAKALPGSEFIAFVRAHDALPA